MVSPALSRSRSTRPPPRRTAWSGCVRRCRSGPWAIVAEEAGRRDRPSLTSEQRWDRPPPTAEQLAAAKFKVGPEV